MDVLLVSAPILGYYGGRPRPIGMDAARSCPPYGVYLLATILRRAGHGVVVADLIAGGNRSLKPYHDALDTCALVGIGSSSLAWPTTRSVIKAIRRRRPDVPIVLGGIHPTMFDRYVLESTPVQFVVRGEAEVALPALCDALARGTGPERVPNLSWRRPDGSIVRNPVAPKLSGQDLCAFPVPDYSALPPGVYQGLGIESSRGCAFDCSFCSTSYRQGWRPIPAEQFVDRLELVMQHLDRTKPGWVQIVDDEFSTDPGRAVDIMHTIRRRGLRPIFALDSRANDLLYDGYVESMAPFVARFLVGAECGYDEGLDRVGKGTTCDKLEAAARRLQQHGMSDRASFSFILGLPWETQDDVQKTIGFAMRLFGRYGVRVLLQWYTLIPGSRLWDEERRKQVVNETMYDDYGFFRDRYLFRAGVPLTPRAVWEVIDMLTQLRGLADLRYPGENPIKFAVPDPMRDYFPRDILDDERAGLGSLREVSHPERSERGSPTPDPVP